jgi:hypothetical protein
MHRATVAWDLGEAALLARMEKAFGARAGAVVATRRIDRAGASPSDLFFAIQSDLFSGRGSTLIAERKALQGGAPACRQVLADHQGAPVGNTGHTLGALHAMDVSLKFNNVTVGVGGLPSMAGPLHPDCHAGRPATWCAAQPWCWTSPAMSMKIPIRLSGCSGPRKADVSCAGPGALRFEAESENS